MFTKMFTKHDEEFAEIAADPARRRAAIADFSKRRTLIFWCASFVSLLAFVSILVSKSAGVGLVFFAATQWVLVFKVDSDLTLLRVIDRLHRDEKTGA